MRFSITRLAFAMCLGLALPSLTVQAAPNATSQSTAPAKVSHVEGITEYRLANGLRVLLAPDASKPTTTVNVTYLVGSRHENYGETGMAHLLEHLVFKGTPNLPDKTIDEQFSRRGMRSNGTTSYDRTNYFETFPASEDNLDWALMMEADRMVNSFIARKDLESEFSVVRNEMERGENNPLRILIQQMTASAYQWHNYGKSTIGARSDVEKVKVENLQAFYRQYYQPDNAVLIVTGQFDEAKTLAKIARYFGAIAKPTRLLQPTYTEEPQQDGVREVTVSRVGDAQIVAALYHTAPGAHPDAAAMELLSAIMGDVPNGRLHKALIETKKAAAIRSLSYVLKDPGHAMFFAVLNKTQSREEAKTILVTELETLAKKPITEAELQRAKTMWLNAHEKIMADPAEFGIELSEAIGTGDWRLFFKQRDQIEAVTLADVQRVAENYLRESNRTEGQFVPTEKIQRAQIPAAPDLAELLGNYQGKAAVAQGEAFDPSPANIEARTTRSTLNNGLKLALLAKKTRGETVSGSLTLNIGDVDSLKGKSTQASLAAAMLMRGAGELSRQAIADKLDALKSKVAISADAESVRVDFESRRAQLPELLALLTTILRKPSFPASEFETLRTESLTSLEMQMRQPEAQGVQAVLRHGNPYPLGDVRAVSTFEEQLAELKAVKLEDVKAFHEAFYGAEQAELALVGDFEQAQIVPRLQQLLGDWKAQRAYQRVPNPFIAIKADAFTLETPDKANAFFYARLPLAMTDTSPDYLALALASRVFGSGMSGRLMTRLRQKDGISYGAGATLSVDALDNNGELSMSAIYAPQNLAKLKAGVSEEFARLVKDGITEQELADAKSGFAQNLILICSDDARLASLLTRQLHQQRTMAFTAEQQAKLQALTLAEVNGAVRKHFDPSKLVQAWAGDFANAAKKAGAPVKSAD